MKNKIIMCIVLLFAVILRMLYINNPFWYDEACSWFSANQVFPYGILDNLLSLDLQHTPLYFFLLHLWMKLFGNSEIALRFLSLIFGVLSVFLTYKVSDKISQNKKVALFSALICAINPLLVLFSVEVRMYPVAIFLVLLSLNYLIDFEQKETKKSLIKLIITNLLLVYTYSGGIFYNISLLIFYGKYLSIHKNEQFKRYIKYSKYEWLGLIPYFVLMAYYGLNRVSFVISHEGSLRFFQIVDVVRNFFGANIISNVYWPSVEPYQITFLFALLVVVPCVYFIYGFCKGLFKSNGFIKTLYLICLSNFSLFVMASFFKINVFTVRYMIYLLPVLFILSVLGMEKTLSKKHFKVFLSLYILFASCFSISNAHNMYKVKKLAFKSVAIEAKNLNLTPQDIVIMPFGSDAPYYFRKMNTPRVINFDFHKIVRNPYGIYYDYSQKNLMNSSKKYDIIYERIFKDDVFSTSFFNYFTQSVNGTVQRGRYVLVAFYGEDANAVMPIQTLRQLVVDRKYIKKHTLDVLFKKYMYDIFSMLSIDFNLINSFKKDNYTYYLFQKI